MENCKSQNQDVRIYSGQRRRTFLFCVVPCFCLFCFSFFSLFQKFLNSFRMLNFSILESASVVPISHVSFHAKRQRPFFVSCFLFLFFLFFVLFCLIMFVSPVFTFSAWIGKTTLANGAVVVRWRCGWHREGWQSERLAVGGWRTKTYESTRLLNSNGQRRGPLCCFFLFLCFFLCVFLFVFPFFFLSSLKKNSRALYFTFFFGRQFCCDFCCKQSTC